MKTSIWCRKWPPQWREGDAAYLPQSQNSLDNRVYFIRPRRQLQSDHFDGTSLHDHCYIQSEKIITRNEQFIGQQNLSILKFHQSIRGLSRDKFTRGSGLVFFNEIWWKYFVWTKFFTIYVILEEMEGILLGCHLLRRPHEIKQNVSCVLSYLFF